MSNRIYIYLFLGLLVLSNGCGKTDEEVNILLEDTYNQGWYDAIDCVKNKGGFAQNAADDCEDE